MNFEELEEMRKQWEQEKAKTEKILDEYDELIIGDCGLPWRDVQAIIQEHMPDDLVAMQRYISNKEYLQYLPREAGGTF